MGLVRNEESADRCKPTGNGHAGRRTYKPKIGDIVAQYYRRVTMGDLRCVHAADATDFAADRISGCGYRGPRRWYVTAKRRGMPPEFTRRKRKSPPGNEFHISPTLMLLRVRDYQPSHRKDHHIEFPILATGRALRACPTRCRGFIPPSGLASDCRTAGIPAAGHEFSKRKAIPCQHTLTGHW